MTTVETLERRLDRVESRSHHTRLLLSLFGDMREWEYTGTAIDHGAGAATGPNPPRCACGHPVRFQFEIRRKDGSGKAAYVGSHCIEYVGVLAPELGEALSRAAADLEARVREAQARAKRAAAEAEAQAALERYKAAWEVVESWVEEQRSWRRLVPKPLWWAMLSRRRWVLPPWGVPPYQRPADVKKWAVKQLEYLLQALEESGLYSLEAKAKEAANGGSEEPQKGGKQ